MCFSFRILSYCLDKALPSIDLVLRIIRASLWGMRGLDLGMFVAPHTGS